MARNETLNERIEEMEVRSVQLSKELAKISQNWKKSRKIDIQRYSLEFWFGGVGCQYRRILPYFEKQTIIYIKIY